MAYGNPNFQTGQLAVTGSAALIPWVVSSGLDPERLNVCPTADVFLGGPGVTVSTGLRVPANASVWITSRAPLYAVTATTATLTWLLETN